MMKRLLLAFALVIAAAPLLAAPDTTRKRIDIPAQALTPALERLARERDLQIIYLAEKTDALQTEGVRGELTPDEALARLLQGTGLTYRYLDEHTLTIVTAPRVLTSRGTSEESSAASTSAVTIEGHRPDLEHQVQTYVRSVTRRSGDQSLPRWRVPICPLVAGLPADQGELILRRISEIARSVGAPLGPEKCRPNFYIIATAKTGSDKPVRVLYDARLETVDGLPLYDTQISDQKGLGVTLTGPTVGDSRIEFGAVTHLASVVALIDTARVSGYDVGQLTDYIAMVGFTELDPGADVGNAPTILRLFTTPAQNAPQGLSPWDESFLRGLYSTGQSFRLQRSQITRRMLSDLNR